MHIFLSFEWEYEEAKASNRHPTHLIYLLFINGLKKVLTHLQKIKKYISDTGPVQA